MSTEFAIKNQAIYHTPDDIKNLKISVTFDAETRYFNWQQKIYSKFERDFYKDEKNCVTDLERKYHEDVSHLVGDGVLFSYTNEDRFIAPDDYEGRIISNYGENVTKTSDFVFEQSIAASLSNPIIWDACEIMYIMADLGEYVYDVWIKNEHVLCTIRYERERKMLLINPDFSKTKPYLLQVNAETLKTYQYFIENASAEIDETSLAKEDELLQKLLTEKLKLRAEIVGQHFESPPKTNTIHLFCEIGTAANFENSNIYVRYFIDLPKNFTCQDPTSLTGTTQTSKGPILHHFGHNFQVALQQDDTSEQFESPYIYFEVVSKDSWSRFRTEGLAFQCLPVFKAGYSEYRLNCLRICPGGVSGELRRFFIGDFACYNDITWVGLPKDHEENVINKYGVRTIPTGELFVKLWIIRQRNANIEDESPKRDFLSKKLQSSNLLRSVADVIRAFKKARKNMIETRKNL